ncbi:glycosyltransferase [Marinobacter zhanjiangensis]|uniref:glycosyltransferase n=1 Tax=Marinobacter zhanjiangensis TaxID=578215 RepID=UPI001676B85A|nr:glycosyltransferase [Marinobacter zhanjiangensis]
MTTRLPFVSFIIPALNEEENILCVIQSIKSTMPDQTYQIIIADNGSTDRTRSIAEAAGSIVLKEPEATIASLRNFGVESAKGDILVFLDADITLAQDWHKILIEDYQSWPGDRLIITGNRCLAPDSGEFIVKNWFNKLSNTRSNYINSGHMITTKTMHNKINGFDSNLKTSEDYDYCLRAIKENGTIRPNTSLKAYHHGYPRTILNFMAREAWHGKEDMSSFKRFFNSRTAILAVVNSTLIALSPTLYIIKGNAGVALIPLLMSTLLCIAITPLKFGRQQISQWIKTASCFELYLLGRTASIFFTKKRPSART